MKKDFVSFYDNQVLPISFINNFISEYIEKNNLNKSLNKIKYVNNNELGVGCSAGYDVNSKILLIDFNRNFYFILPKINKFYFYIKFIYFF